MKNPNRAFASRCQILLFVSKFESESGLDFPFLGQNPSQKVLVKFRFCGENQESSGGIERDPSEHWFYIGEECARAYRLIIESVTQRGGSRPNLVYASAMVRHVTPTNLEARFYRPIIESVTQGGGSRPSLA